ncbi:MAG: hypothetical protein R6W91_00170, partial [Thermoplasmata archaeon]
MDLKKLSTCMIAIMLVSVGFGMLLADNTKAAFIEQLSNNGLSSTFVPQDTAWNEAGTLAVVVGYDTNPSLPNAYAYWPVNDTYTPLNNSGYNSQKLSAVDYFSEPIYGWAFGGTRRSDSEVSGLASNPSPTPNLEFLPWSDDMENMTAEWSTVDLTGAGAPWHLDTWSYHSPSYSWVSAFDYSGDYDAEGVALNTILWTPALDFFSYDSDTVEISFYERYSTESGMDYLNIVYSTNGGGSYNWLPERNNMASGSNDNWPDWDSVTYTIPGPYTSNMKIGF